MNISVRSFALGQLIYKQPIKYNFLFNRKIIENVRISTQVSHFHVAPVYFKRRKTTEERKSAKILEYTKSKAPVVNVWRDITLIELSNVIQRDVNHVKDLFLNQISNPHTKIDDLKYLQQALKRGGFRMQIIGKPSDIQEDIEEKNVFPRPPPSKEQLKPRPPVVTVMGHVDHGKTTLLDALRHSNVVDKEFGGITQHIGAFNVVLDSGARITFLDTPGHAAFSAMRARGANLTDIVVLVVAADDGVMEQTVESVKMARKAKVPILVAINKIDAPKADVERAENMLIQIGIQVERLGGEVQAVPISALKRKNLDKLTEALVLQAELLELGADPTGPVEAIVVESKADQHRGKLCTVVVQRGTLKRGDILVAGTSMAKVRLLKDAEGKIMDKAPPGYPAEIEGWKSLPSAGDLVLQVASERQAKQVLRVREEEINLQKLQEDAKIMSAKQEDHEKAYKERLEYKRKLGRFKLRREGPRTPEISKEESTIPILNILVKGDVDGTLEAILDTLSTYDCDETCKLDLVHYGVGAITKNDLELAEPFKAIIYAFNTKCPQELYSLAEEKGVQIRHFNVIYKLVDDLKGEINSRLPLKEIEDILGEAQFLKEFEITYNKKKVPVAGCRCVKGVLKRSALYRVVRNGEIVHTGTLSSMRHLKDEVDSVQTELECGLQLTDRNIRFEEGDKLVCFEKRQEIQKTEWNPGF